MERKLYHLAYDVRLEPLIENVIDVYRIADSFETKLSRGPDGRPLAVTDHYAANFKDEEVARSEYRARAPRCETAHDIPPMAFIDPTEQQWFDSCPVRGTRSGRDGAHTNNFRPVLDRRRQTGRRVSPKHRPPKP